MHSSPDLSHLIVDKKIAEYRLLSDMFIAFVCDVAVMETTGTKKDKHRHVATDYNKAENHELENLQPIA